MSGENKPTERPDNFEPWNGHPPNLHQTQYHWLGEIWRNPDGTCEVAWVDAFEYSRKTNCWRGINEDAGGSVEAEDIARNYVYAGPIEWPKGFEWAGRRVTE